MIKPEKNDKMSAEIDDAIGQANQGLDFDLIADEMTQDLKE